MVEGRASLVTWWVTAGLTLLTVIVTWPLGAELTRSLPGDYGDPLFVTWVMGWVNGRILTGAFDGFWNANIFFPEPMTLAFSEHFIAQSVMVLPVYWVSSNAILSYNVAFLLTFVLTGTGTFLLARALTGSVLAAVVAAVIAAFNEYRLVYEVAHLHTLSIHWLPFALYALHRYLVTDKRRYLAGTAAALVALNLSSIYYMAYCAPFVLLFAIAEAIRLGRWRVGRVWLELWATAAVVAVVMLPFVLPYIHVQQRLGVERSLDEIRGFSATLDHYRVALPAMSAALVLAVAGLVGVLRVRVLWPVAFTLAAFVVLAFWLSLGPVVQSGGQTLEWPGLYTVLHTYVPGFGGLRVPARFAMLFFVFLALLAGVGIAVVERGSATTARVLAVVALAVFVVSATPARLALNQPLPSEGLATPPPDYLTPSINLPPIYREVAALRPTAVLAELPFGDSWYELRYMYFSAIHRRRLLNGYSGIFPPSYLARQRVLQQPLLDPAASAQALGAATHVIVHRSAWTDDTGLLIGAWLQSLGAKLIAEADRAALYELPVREEFAVK